MICRVCAVPVLGSTAITEPVIRSNVYQMYATCPHCSATHAFVMWMSESEALQRHEEDERNKQHRSVMAELEQARKAGATYAVIRRLEQREEHLAYAE